LFNLIPNAPIQAYQEIHSDRDWFQNQSLF
jgi:hypothetical protein